MKKTELQKGIKIESEHKDTIDFLKPMEGFQLIKKFLKILLKTI